MSFQPRVVGRRLTVAVSTRTNIALGAGRREAETGIYKRRRTMAIVNSAGNATFGVVESGGSAFVILTALIILFGAAAYFTGRLYGTPGFDYLWRWVCDRCRRANVPRRFELRLTGKFGVARSPRHAMPNMPANEGRGVAALSTPCPNPGQA